MKPTHNILGLILLAGALAHVSSAQPLVMAVLNSASYSAAVSPGCLVTILGSNLATAAVKVGGLTATLLYTSPNQLNALIPSDVEIPSNTVVPLVVTSSSGSATYNVRLTRNAPGIFTVDGSGTGFALAFDAGFHQAATIHPRDVVILYAAGLGPVDSSGRVIDGVDVYLGERKAQVLYAGLVPAFPGVYQINVIAPTLATDRLYLRSGGWQSNIVYVPIQGGTNTTNVRGAIDGLYPSSDAFFAPGPPCTDEDNPAPCSVGETLSIMLHAGVFSVSFDILPSGGPFDIAAVGEAGGTIISVDRETGTYTASVSTLSPGARVGDFHDSIVPLWDYAGCGNDSACFAFPGPSLIPLSRIDPFWARATQMLPDPNMTVPGSPNAFLQTSGTINGSHFVIGDQNNSALTRFGGIIQVPLGPYVTALSTFRLYVDGHLIATKSLVYEPAHRCFFTGPGQFCWGLLP